MEVTVQQLTANDVTLMKALLKTFGEVFNDMDTYTTRIPSDDYLQQLLGSVNN